MPLIPEAVISMLATARLGAIHSVVFGGIKLTDLLLFYRLINFYIYKGFAANELRTRIEHAEPKVIIAASCGVEPNKVIR